MSDDKTIYGPGKDGQNVLRPKIGMKPFPENDAVYEVGEGKDDRNKIPAIKSSNSKLIAALQSENTRLKNREEILKGAYENSLNRIADLESSRDQFAIDFAEWMRDFEKEDGRQSDAPELLDLYKQSLMK